MSAAANQQPTPAARPAGPPVGPPAGPEDAVSGRPAVSTTVPAVYTDLGRIIESMTRRFLDVLRMELARIGIDDLSPGQALMLINIGGEELSVRDLLERGYYLGSNASYNLKHLVEAGYVDRSASQRDRRTARLRLSERGLRLCEALRGLEAVRSEALIRSDEEAADLETTYRTLRRLERAWSDLIRYDTPEY